jgi:L-2-hydroxyglutarate oxidase
MKIIIVGGGIVGLAIAKRLSELKHSVTLLEKEGVWASHQTGRNSGVIHAGPYYKPGSLKAKMCVAGNLSMVDFARANGIRHEVCGKLIVATDKKELGSLRDLASRARDNGVESEILSRSQSLEIEPHVPAVEALWVKRTGIIDYSEVSEALVRLSTALGANLMLNAEVQEIRSLSKSILVQHSRGETEGDILINAAGLQSDRIAKLAALNPKVKIIPFRGEYFELIDSQSHLVKNLIYPVPNPEMPFLGVHFTRMIDGGVHAGPNAVLAAAREGYQRSNINIRDLFETLSYSGFQRLALKNVSVGLYEMQRSLSKRLFTKSLQKLIPEIRPEYLKSSPSGVRAQAVDKRGMLVDDFVIEKSQRQIHILNAPSPAATVALEIANYIAEEVQGIQA